MKSLRLASTTWGSNAQPAKDTVVSAACATRSSGGAATRLAPASMDLERNRRRETPLDPTDICPPPVAFLGLFLFILSPPRWSVPARSAAGTRTPGPAAGPRQG